ncbi:MAG: translation initiation factor IF-2 [Bacteroidia bacterium]
MAEAKAKRLSKVARELNVATTTIVEFLDKKGHEIEQSPNTKVPEELYVILLEQFQPDKIVGEKAHNIQLPDLSKRQEKESSEEGDEVLVKSNTVSETPAPPKDEPVKEKTPEPAREEAPVEDKIEETAEPEVKKEQEKEKEETAPVAEEQPETPPEAPVEAKQEGPKKLERQQFKVVGKLDLDALKARPAKKQEEKKEAEKAEIEEAAEIVEVPEEKEIEPVAEEKKEEGIEEEKPEVQDQQKEEEKGEKRPEKRETVMKEAQGLKIVGKIDLDKIQKKKPVASTSDLSSIKKKRRKRKRIAGAPETKAPDTRQRGGAAKKERAPKAADKPEIDDKQIQEQIKATLSRLSGQNPKQASKSRLKKKKKEQREQKEAGEVEQETTTLQLTEFITVKELASIIDVPVTDVITACMGMGMMVSINQRLDAEAITFIADEFGHDVEFKDVDVDEPSMEEEDNPENLIDRAPIVTIMGHVDHGKTSLLDYIRSSNIIAGEAGGITQHIGAYAVVLENDKNITFLDTPGHEAFTAMRARGAKVTDVAIIVVAADDSVMPQTKEAISHAQAAGVPIVFAINKVDKEVADPTRIKQQLADMNLLVEEWGGKYQSQDISAKQGMHIDDLLEKVLLEAEMLELKADPKKRAVGTVIEASMDKGKGIVATVLVEGGTLEVGDPILAGSHYGKVKALNNERGARVGNAGPSTPVQVLGFDGAPQAGDKFYVTESETQAKDFASKRRQLIREQGIRARKHITLDEIGRRLAIGNFKELNVIIKGDVDGSIEALSDSLLKLSTQEIQVNVIHKGVGQISESDVLLASASDAVIIGFQVRPSISARKLAEQEQIEIRLYSVIYDAIEEVKAAMEGMLAPSVEERIISNIEVRDVFKITKVGTVAGCMVLDGKVHRNSKVRLVRQGVVVYDGEIHALKRFKDDVKEVAAGYECGISIKNYNDIKSGDIIEAYEEVEVKRKL